MPRIREGERPRGESLPSGPRASCRSPTHASGRSKPRKCLIIDLFLPSPQFGWSERVGLGAWSDRGSPWLGCNAAHLSLPFTELGAGYTNDNQPRTKTNRKGGMGKAHIPFVCLVDAYDPGAITRLQISHVVPQKAAYPLTMPGIL